MSYIFIVIVIVFNIYGENPIQYNLIEGMPNIYISRMSEKIGHTWTNGSVWEKHLIQKFYALLKKHDDFFVMFDLGAQTGCFSLLAKYFPHSEWYAFEPIIEAVEALKENLVLNNISNVRVYNNAVTDYVGSITLKMPAMNEWGLSTIGVNPLRFDTFTEREVSCITLDDFVDKNNIKKVHFMKLDTEGSELSILQGAVRMLQRDHPTMIIEYNATNMRQCGFTKKNLEDFLIHMGYQWQLISSEDILCIPR